MEVAHAVQLSTAYPIFYKYINYNNTLWTDGGLSNNFAIDYYDTENFVTSPLESAQIPTSSMTFNPKTLGLFMYSNQIPVFNKVDSNRISSNYFTPTDYLSMLVNTMGFSNVKAHIRDLKKRNIIFINTFDVSTLDFNIDIPIRKKLIESGFNATNTFIKKKMKVNKLQLYTDKDI